MGVGEDVTVGTDNEPRTHALLGCVVARLLVLKLPEKIAERIVTVVRERVAHPPNTIALPLLDDGDVDHCRTDLLDQCGEVRQPPHQRRSGSSHNRSGRRHARCSGRCGRSGG